MTENSLNYKSQPQRQKLINEPNKVVFHFHLHSVFNLNEIQIEISAAS